MNGAGLKTGCIAGLGTSGVARIWEQRIVSSISWQRLGGFAEICQRDGDISSILRVQTGPGVHSALQNQYRGLSPGIKASEVGLATLPLPSTVVLSM